LQYLTTDADLGDAAHIVLFFEFLRCCPNLRGLKIKVNILSVMSFFSSFLLLLH